MTRLFVPAAATFTFLSVRPLPARIQDTRLPPPQLVAGEQDWGAALWPESNTAFSAWKVWPRHTVTGWVQVLPLTVHCVLPSVAVSPVERACVAQLPWSVPPTT